MKSTYRSLLSQALLEAHVSRLSKNQPITINEKSSTQEAIALLKKHHTGSVLVCDSNGLLTGIFTEQDVIRRVTLSNSKLATTAVKNFMTAKPESVLSRTSIARGIYIMASGGYRHLPLVGRDQTPEGVVSVRDTVHYIFSLIQKNEADEEGAPFLEAEALASFLDSPASDLATIAVTVPEDTTLREAIEVMIARKTGALCILSETDELQGIFTERDLINKLFGVENFLSQGIGTAMTREPRTVRAGSSMRHCVRLMSDGGFRHLPIVDRDNKAVSILSVRAFIKAFGASIVADIESIQNQ